MTRGQGETLVELYLLLSSCGDLAFFVVAETTSKPARSPGSSRHPKNKGFKTGWWFGTFFIFPYIRDNHPN